MVKQIYRVKPRDGINGRYWGADDCGLKYLENYYSNYGDDNVDRWHEFEVEKVEPAICIDFGGAVFTDTPRIDLDVGGVEFSFLIHQAEGVFSCIDCESYKNSGVWRFNGRWTSVVIGPELRDRLYEITKNEVDTWAERWESFCKMALARTNKRN